MNIENKNVETDEGCSENINLRNEIKEKDDIIHKSATFGIQLLEEKKVLLDKLDQITAKNEALEQEKYSLQMELEASSQSLKSHTTELESLREKADNLERDYKVLQKNHSDLQKKFNNGVKENESLRKEQEDMLLNHNALKDKIVLQEEQIRVFQNQVEISVCEISRDDISQLQLQENLNAYMSKTKELQDDLSEKHHQLEMAKVKEGRLKSIIDQLEQDVLDRDKEIASYSVEVKKTKDEMNELQGEIELLKFDRVDTNQRGNSMFAELDDRRKFVEKEYRNLNTKFETMRKNYEENKQELGQVRGQMTVLLSMTSRQCQQDYIEKLENSLSASQNQVKELNNKLDKMIRSQQNSNSCHRTSQCDEYNYLRVMLQQAQKREKALENELMNQRMKSMIDCEKLTEVQQCLYVTKLDLDDLKRKHSELKTQMKELQMLQTLQKCDVENVPEKPNVEVLPWIKPANVTNEPQKTKLPPCLLDSTLGDLIIPGEIELGDDGFKHVRPPRKSNKFVLREYNTVIEDECSNSKPKPSKRNFIETSSSSFEKRESSDPNNRNLNKSNFPVSKERESSKYDNCTYQ